MARESDEIYTPTDKLTDVDFTMPEPYWARVKQSLEILAKKDHERITDNEHKRISKSYSH